jgi:pilus assembly protein Flp/PilA
MTALIARFLAEDRGATAVEYGVIVAVIAIGLLAAFSALGGGLQHLFENVSNRAGNVMDSAT